MVNRPFRPDNDSRSALRTPSHPGHVRGRRSSHTGLARSRRVGSTCSVPVIEQCQLEQYAPLPPLLLLAGRATRYLALSVLALSPPRRSALRDQRDIRRLPTSYSYPPQALWGTRASSHTGLVQSSRRLVSDTFQGRIMHCDRCFVLL